MKIVIAYASIEGQSEKIARKIAEILELSDISCVLINTIDQPGASLPADANGLIAGGPLHREQHPEELRSWLVVQRELWIKIPCAFFSVSLSAASDRQQDLDDATRVMQQFLEEIDMLAEPAMIIAGALKYSRYGFIKRRILRNIVKKSGGKDLDMSRDYEYTDWEQVEGFAKALVERTSITD